MNDYIEILLSGYYSTNTKEHLISYFIRKFKEAQRDKFYQPNEFFGGCLETIKYFKKNSEDRHKRWLADEDRLKATGRSYEPGLKKTPEEMENAIASTTPEEFPVPLGIVTKNKIGGNIRISELEFIKEALEEAYSKVELIQKANIINQQQNPVIKQKFKTGPNRPEKLDVIFDSISKYKYIMELLVSKGYIQPNTYIWIDDGKGNKAFLAALIKYLHSQGYYKENKKPSNTEIQAIIKNTFGWEIGIDTVNRANPAHFNFLFIPPASTVQ